MKKPKEIDGKATGRDSKGKFTEGNSEGVKFGPGNNANPKGRRNAMSDIIRKILDEDDGKIREELSIKLVDHARVGMGDDFLKALDRIMDRTEGKPTQPTADVSEGWQKFLDGVLEGKQE